MIGEDETVEGDLATFAGTVVVQGTVGGEVLIEGEVAGDAEAFAGNLRIAGNVGGEVSTAAGNVVVEEGASVARSRPQGGASPSTAPSRAT